MFDQVLFVAWPYVAVAICVGGGIYRYKQDRFSYSSFSSQFLENRGSFFSIPWHYGIILILGAHVIAALVPGLWQQVLGDNSRIVVLEITGLALAMLAIIGLTVLVLRRLVNSKVGHVTSVMDWIVLLVLLAQVFLGFWVALYYRWGSDWYLRTAVPWLVSLAKFKPDTQYVTVLPWVVKAHMVGGFLIIALFPFTRLVHIVTYPLSYLWRPYQLVIWNRRARSSR